VYEVELPVNAEISALYNELTKQIGSDVMDNISNAKFYYPMVEKG
jgi:hypothetical protein